jgi:hypothetical protein
MPRASIMEVRRLLDGLINYGGWGLVSADAPGPGLGPARLLGNRLAPAGRPPLETAPQLSLGPPPPPLTRLLRQRPCSLFPSLVSSSIFFSCGKICFLFARTITLLWFFPLPRAQAENESSTRAAWWLRLVHCTS